MEVSPRKNQAKVFRENFKVNVPPLDDFHTVISTVIAESIPICFASTAMAKLVFITACTENHENYTLDGDQKTVYLFTIIITIWSSSSGRKFKLKISANTSG